MPRIKVKGIRQVKKNLASVVDPKKLQESTYEAAQVVRNRIQQLTPKETGRLSNSYQLQRFAAGNIVGTDIILNLNSQAFYGSWIEFGYQAGKRDASESRQQKKTPGRPTKRFRRGVPANRRWIPGHFMMTRGANETRKEALRIIAKGVNA